MRKGKYEANISLYDDLVEVETIHEKATSDREWALCFY